MKRSALALGALALLSVPVASTAQGSGPVDGAIEQSVLDTMAAHLQRRGFLPTDPIFISTIAAVKDAIDSSTDQGCYAAGTPAGQETWACSIKNVLPWLPWPVSVGRNGSFGGGGASGDFSFNCGDLKIKFDAQGFLIIPSRRMTPGGPIDGTVVHYSGTESKADSSEAAALWRYHKWNIDNFGADKRRWFGFIAPFGTSNSCFSLASPAFWDGETLVPRYTASACTSPTYTFRVRDHNGLQDRPCPESSDGGGDFDFYASGLGWDSYHMHQCTFYAPDISLSPTGYAINPETSIPFTPGTWPEAVPEEWKQCPIDPAFTKALTDALYQKAEGEPGYDGAPHSPVTAGDARPGDTVVEDLEDNPKTGADPTPDPDAEVPPPTPTPTPTPPSGGTDLGPDPGISQPTLDEPPSGILDPIFDWLPDLPSLELNVSGASCPTWQMQPFEGPEWNLTMDSHCGFIEDNQALIATIMIIGFSIGAAMIILRA